MSKACPTAVGRRQLARLRLGLPATLLLLTGTHRGTLVDLSRSGARIAVSAKPRIGAEAVLQVPGFEVFGTVVWVADDGKLGMQFDRLLEPDRMLEMRAYLDHFPQRTQELMRSSVRDWVNGTSRLL